MDLHCDRSQDTVLCWWSTLLGDAFCREFAALAACVILNSSASDILTELSRTASLYLRGFCTLLRDRDAVVSCYHWRMKICRFDRK